MKLDFVIMNLIKFPPSLHSLSVPIFQLKSLHTGDMPADLSKTGTSLLKIVCLGVKQIIDL